MLMASIALGWVPVLFWFTHRITRSSKNALRWM